MITAEFYKKENATQRVECILRCRLPNYYLTYLKVYISYSDWISYSERGETVDKIFYYLDETEKQFLRLNNKFYGIKKLNYLTEIIKKEDKVREKLEYNWSKK